MIPASGLGVRSAVMKPMPLLIADIPVPDPTPAAARDMALGPEQVLTRV